MSKRLGEVMEDTAQTMGELSPQKRALVAQLLEREGVDAGNTPIVPGERQGRDVPLSFAQERLWFLQRLNPQSTAYNVPIALEIGVPVRVGVLESALNGLIARHEILRTVFPAIEGKPVQRIVEDVTLHLREIELRGVPGESLPDRLARAMEKEWSKPFNLLEDYPIRAAFLREDESRGVLLFTLHHIATDGWSTGVLLRDFYAFYAAVQRATAAELEPLPIQYADYAIWQRRVLGGTGLAEHLRYWTRKMAGARPLGLAADGPRPGNLGTHGASVVEVLSANLSERLRELSRKEGVTLFMTLLAGFKVLLARTTGQTDITVGSPVANRDRPETIQLIGFFVNMLALRTDLSGAPTVREVLNRVRAVALEAFEHQALPFERLVSEVAQERDKTRNPLFQVTFGLEQAQAVKPAEMRGQTLGSVVGVETNTARFDMEAHVTDHADGLAVSLTYNTELFEASTVRRMLRQLLCILQGMVDDPERRITDLPLAAEGFMSTMEFLTHLRSQDVRVTLETDRRLRITAPPGVVRDALKAELTSRKEELIEFLEDARRRGDQAPIERISRGGDLPVSLAQQRLWFLDRLEGGGATYNVAGAARLQGFLDPEAMIRAMKELVRRHEMLRASFPTVDGRPKVVIGSPEATDIDVIDLRSLPEDARELEAQRLLTETVRSPFDLAGGPLLRTRLVQVGNTDQLLVYCMHHIISDGWSLEIFGQELGALYEAFRSGRPSPLPELRVQYVDFAHWQQAQLESGKIDAQLRYWTEHLGGQLPVLMLPMDRPRPPLQTFRGARLRTTLSRELADELKGYSRDEGASLFMTLLAAFKVLLHRYTGEEDVVVGSPTANRSRPELEAIIGFFVNNLVLRTDLSGDPTFRELLARVRKTVLNAHANQDVPFDRLVEVLRPQRDVSHSPLFQVMFNSPTVPTDITGDRGAELTPVELEIGTSRFDLTVEVYERKRSSADRAVNAWQTGGLELFFEFNTDLFDRDTVAKLRDHYVRLLESICQNPDERISSVAMLTQDEREKILTRWKGVEAPYRRERCIHELFEEQVQQRPEGVAVETSAETVSYRELDQRANRLANRLQRLGVGPESLVGICLDRSINMVVAMLATLKAGGAYVPMDPAFPSERLGFMMQDAGVQILITEDGLAGREHTGDEVVVNLDAERDSLAGESAAKPVADVAPDNLAYVIYTSGSTGKPKGVAVEHHAVVNFLESMAREPGLNCGDRLLSVTTLSFDIVGLEIYLPLIVGATVIVASRAVATDAMRLAELLGESRATVMQATPATWRMLVQAGWDGTSGLKMLCGGEALPRELAGELLARGGALWNMYGPTETTIWSTIHEVESSETSIPIGRPIANTQIFILDRHLQPVPIGVAGELYIGGKGVARGYLNRPELTTERFVPHPFSENPDDRLYRTGDLARYTRAGVIEFLGRIDGQIKVRGFRIELGEIEAVLCQHPEIRQATVTLREDVPGDQRLAAYLVTADGRSLPDRAELQRHLKVYLPDYMIPSTFTRLQAMPLTPNGKIDRRALPEPERNGGGRSTFASPETAIERTIAAIWQDVLRLEQVGRHDNFFDLGGHSLLVVQVHSKLETTLKRSLALVDLFQYPTVASLGAFLTKEGPVSPSFDRARERAQRQLQA